jgi:hypothetical protein
MRTFLIAGAAAIALATAAAAETRNLSGFTGVAAEDQVDVEIRTGEGYSVNVTGRDAARIRTEVRNGTLKIRDANRPWFGRYRVLDATVAITLPRLEELAAARGAEIEARDITARDISISAAMGGVIEISGTCAALDVSVAMGGVLDADNFRCATADISAAMGGVAEVYATERFDASAAMGGTIDIAGGARGESSSSMGGVISH